MLDLRFARLALAPSLLVDALSFAVALDRAERVTSVRDILQPKHDNRGRRPGLADSITSEVGHRLDSSPRLTNQDGVTLSQRARLDQQCGSRTLTSIEFCLQHHTVSKPIRIGGKLGNIGDQQQGVEQVAHPIAARGRHCYQRHVAAVLLDLHLNVGQCRLHSIGIDVVEVHLVQRHDVGHAGSVNVTDCFASLRHDTVIGGDDKNRDISRLGTACAHLSKGRVAGRVDERDQAIVGRRLVGADPLCDTARLALGNVGATDVVEQRGLAVVNVSKDGDDGRSLAQVGRIVFLYVGCSQDVDRGRRFCLLDNVSSLFGIEAAIHGDDRGGAVIERLGDIGHDPVGHQGFDDHDRRFVEQIREFAHGQRARNQDVVLGGRCCRCLTNRLLCGHGCSGGQGISVVSVEVQAGWASASSAI